MNAEQPQPHSQALEGEEIVPGTHSLHMRLNINCFCRVLVVSSMFNHTRSYVRNNLGFSAFVGLTNKRSQPIKFV